METLLANHPKTKEFFEEVVKKAIPSAKIKLKSESWLMKTIDFVLKPISKDFSTTYFTTIGTTIYLPNNFSKSFTDDQVLTTVAHEFTHASDYKKSPVMFVLKYMFPQGFASLSIFALFAILNFWGLTLLSFLLMALPWPSMGRTEAEKRGYAMSVACEMWLYGDLWPGTKEFYVEQFVGWSYYRMNPNKKEMIEYFNQIEKDVNSGKILEKMGTPFDLVYNHLKAKNYLSIVY